MTLRRLFGHWWFDPLTNLSTDQRPGTEFRSEPTPIHPPRWGHSRKFWPFQSVTDRTPVPVGQAGDGVGTLRGTELPGVDASPGDGVGGDGLRVVAGGDAAKKNVEVTMEQVCRVLNARTAS